MHILDSAEQLFADKGFDGTSVRNIAGHAGVNLEPVLQAMHIDIHDEETYMKKMIPKIKAHLKELLKAHLDIRNQN